MGDYLTHLGFTVKFRNPRTAGSQYPSLLVDWYTGHVQEVVSLVSDQHRGATRLLEQASSGRFWVGSELAVSDLRDLEVVASSGAQADSLRLRAGARRVALVLRARGTGPRALTLQVEQWTGSSATLTVLGENAAALSAEADVSVDPEGVLTVRAREMLLKRLLAGPLAIEIERKQ